jgi:hypothetical protein
LRQTIGNIPAKIRIIDSIVRWCFFQMKLPPIIHLFEATADLRSGLRGHRRTYLTILKRAWYVLLRLLRPELDLSHLKKALEVGIFKNLECSEYFEVWVL